LIAAPPLGFLISTTLLIPPSTELGSTYLLLFLSVMLDSEISVISAPKGSVGRLMLCAGTEFPLVPS
jgi:hypothetical protein